MAFHFSLLAVLRFRQGVEHQQELLLQKAHQDAALARHGIELADACLAQMGESELQYLQSGLSGAEMHFQELRRAVLKRYRQQLESDLAEREKALAQRSRAFLEARQQREVVDTLRRRQLLAYHAEEARREQRQLDDLFLLRRAIARRS